MNEYLPFFNIHRWNFCHPFFYVTWMSFVKLEAKSIFYRYFLSFYPTFSLKTLEKEWRGKKAKKKHSQIYLRSKTKVCSTSNEKKKKRWYMLSLMPMAKVVICYANIKIFLIDSLNQDASHNTFCCENCHSVHMRPFNKKLFITSLLSVHSKCRQETAASAATEVKK